MHRFILITFFIALNYSYGQPKVKEKLKAQANALLPLAESDNGKTFLKNTYKLPEPPKETIIYHDKADKLALSESNYLGKKSMSSSLKKLTLNSNYFYFTKYGSPLAYLPIIEILNESNFTIKKETKILDFGFGSIGQLMLLSSMGANITGIEIDPVLEVLYNKYNGKSNIQMLYGEFPKNKSLVEKIGNNYDLFVSKNTLKKGYVNPEIEVEKKFLLNLGVSDIEFLKAVYKLLKPGGYFLIYNLHGKIQSDNYKPWTDGRSPFTIEQYQAVGFKVKTFNKDDTHFARKMGKKLEWDKKMNFEEHLFATFILLQK